jgi:hypothetical protein
MRPAWVAWAVPLVLGLTGAAHAAPPEEAIIPIERYTSEKARSLAVTHQRQLRQLYDVIYRCYEWMEVPERGLGFITPKGASGDERYLNLWVWIDQQITPAFAAAPVSQRASAMFQAYGLDLLRRLSSHSKLVEDPSLTGFAVILTWIKPGSEPQPGRPGVHETLSVFVDKSTLQQFLERRVSPAEFIQRAIINGFDGQTGLGRLPLEILGPGPDRATVKADGTPAC